jgi:hypothetical protein
MSKMTEYTLEIYRADRRTKSGLRLIEKLDYDPLTEAAIDKIVRFREAQGFIVRKFETYVTKKNLMGGAEFRERYDTPHYCSPSSESYWSM